MALSLELLPIGTFLVLLTNQVIKTAQAATDVIIEKESFKVLSKYLLDIEPVLKELQLRQLNDSQAARQALDFLQKDVKKANDLVEKYKNRSRFYLLVKCRHIVNEVQDVTRDIGRSLAFLSLASTDVLTDISDKVNKLQNEMQRAKFESSQAQIQIVEKLDQALKDQKIDQANDMLEEIARAVGVPVEPLEISKELASFRQEKEEAADRKERAEAYFLEQVIEFLSRADAAKDQEAIRKHYLRRIQTVERISEDSIPPLQSFICPIEGRYVMVDPVNLCTDTTCEKTAIETWFEIGERTDPKTGEILDNLSLKSNHLLRQSIEEWRELNYCLQIRSAKKKMQSGIVSSVEDAFYQILEIIKENPINKDWIAIEGLIDISVQILGSSNNDNVKRSLLLMLYSAANGHAPNKGRVFESQGIDHIVPCIGQSYLSRIAVELLFELLHDHSGWNISASKKLSEQSDAVLFLVMLLNTESAEKAEEILLQLCNDDDSNIIHAAAANWYKPLINRLVEGPEPSKISVMEAVLRMELDDLNIKSLGEVGVIPPLLKMVSGNIDSKELALSALAKLSSCRENKKLIADSGGVPLILEQMFLSHVRTIITARCSEILERLTSNDGIEFLVNSDKTPLELDKIVTNLLSFQQNKQISNTIRKPILHALLEICRSDVGLVNKAILCANGVSIILPLLDEREQEIREVAINLLFCFSKHEPHGIVDFLLVQRRLAALVDVLKDDTRSHTQMAIAGLLANLPKSETRLTEKLIELDGLQAVLNILISGTTEAKENALGVLFRFTDPTNIEFQRMVVELGFYPLLVNFVKSGTLTAKGQAAALIGNLSSNSHKLTLMISKPKPTSFWCFRSVSVPICEAHGGICSVTSTFCMLEAKALPEIISLFQEKVHATAYEGIQALSTLIYDEKPHSGAKVLHEADAISSILEVLNWGTPSLKGEALSLLAKIFVTREFAEVYGSRARIHLGTLTTSNIHEGWQLGRKAATVLTQLERYSRTSMSYRRGG